MADRQGAGDARAAGVRVEEAGVRVEEVRDASPEVLAALQHLLPQLSSSAPALDLAALESVVAAESTRLLVASTSASGLVGTLTLVLYRIPTGVRALIEDVVVDEGARGRGIASALVNEALRVAADEGARTVDLTSRPSRVAANRLYTSLGFCLRETNVYRYEAPAPGEAQTSPP